jgi:hypothetical protein
MNVAVNLVIVTRNKITTIECFPYTDKTMKKGGIKCNNE